MIAFDTDVLTELLLGRTDYVERATEIPSAEQSVPIVVIEEVMRGRLAAIRHAEAGRGHVSVERAYDLFQATFADFRGFRILAFTSVAEDRFVQWRQQKLRVATHDLRIAAICVAHSATLISRNRRDFEQIPDLSVEFRGTVGDPDAACASLMGHDRQKEVRPLFSSTWAVIATSTTIAPRTCQRFHIPA